MKYAIGSVLTLMLVLSLSWATIQDPPPDIRILTWEGPEYYYDGDMYEAIDNKELIRFRSSKGTEEDRVYIYTNDIILEVYDD